eukprot:TRINITY_DN2644_c0_g1_i3.p2 TRINITY_DN2644_c0_g1~~TRINITY_DN2644_c0_g1_i3.p2  ORF type:complete len:177 (-),score=62.75 TRINITY_DN2644_c0_g1_i3:65-595(-)
MEAAAAVVAAEAVSTSTMPTTEKPGEGLVLRPLEAGDLSRGFDDLLRQLTKVGDLEPRFAARFKEMQDQGNYHTWVVEEVASGQVVASATLMVELKFIHQAGMLGHIEDVVVAQRMRGHDLGRKLVTHLRELGLRLGCYKVTLACSEANVGFYTKCGFTRAGAEMAWYNPTEHCEL